MLEQLKAFFLTHVESALGSLHYLLFRFWSSLLTILVIAMALALPGLFQTLSKGIETRGDWEQKGRYIVLYLKPKFDMALKEGLLQKIENVDGVFKATFKSAEESFKELQKQEGMEDIMRYLPENPLPSMIEVLPKISWNTPAKMEELTLIFKQFEEVSHVRLNLEWLTRFQGLMRFLMNLNNILTLFLGFTVILMVGNTLRFFVSERMDEIRVLKLHGARDGFIMRPFLYAGFWYGVFGAILALFMIQILLFLIGNALRESDIENLFPIAIQGITLKQAYQNIFFSGLLGLVGAGFFVKRQIGLIDP